MMKELSGCSPLARNDLVISSGADGQRDLRAIFSPAASLDRGDYFRIVNEGDGVHVHLDEISHGASGTTLNSLKDEHHAGSV